MDFTKRIKHRPNARTFRYNQKYYLDVALNEPVRIQRSSGESLVVISEVGYKAMLQELIYLQRRLLRMGPTFHQGFMDLEPEKITSITTKSRKLTIVK